MTDRTKLVDHLTRERHRAVAAMTELSGETSACLMGREGRSFPAFKYHEGAVAGLGSLLRTLRREAAGDPAALIDAECAHWEHTSGHGPDWAAYTAGGQDALNDLARWWAAAH
ncbi:hypothetical protein [Corynebacterium alimapuense]|uniref:Uncharacterized protein n=1 Tax=Corynebacterium alimapuense TaxID=1576874 RepID=A0A3M8K6H3_9CORY|nr:hypothetical protein [Corynebacterium alimapuense]RNE48821.1 hypothetical protein C5L39_05835 [Corynebacterium alimapuense]